MTEKWEPSFRQQIFNLISPTTWPVPMPVDNRLPDEDEKDLLLFDRAAIDHLIAVLQKAHLSGIVDESYKWNSKFQYGIGAE